MDKKFERQFNQFIGAMLEWQRAVNEALTTIAQDILEINEKIEDVKKLIDR
jgi:hypothetical protein